MLSISRFEAAFLICTAYTEVFETEDVKHPHNCSNCSTMPTDGIRGGAYIITKPTQLLSFIGRLFPGLVWGKIDRSHRSSFGFCFVGQQACGDCMQIKVNMQAV